MNLDANKIQFAKNFYFLLLNNKKCFYSLMSTIGLVPAVAKRAVFDRRDVLSLARALQADARNLAPKTSDWTKNGLFTHGR
ncbi:MAG: hypothetical protein A2Y03_01050 [Omnitrophica WOR_2 bacterium GWF2_38_59]|nr:MAG: hypothetical protein A2Y03_01050 [Omnitrophica WOR_2 bacterium GWF2_38_59]OGX51300.1 MAG: hypothetical protein A2243_03810 [Omnitrophica WOR_2 bacterium RIFOXYA2_FULL_38_17]OGX56346.1 MAG: hypothetical protein A2306_11480 [Omnitrophica WOR_2 bacterium RIFOXYB2_FULL_38_16]HBG60741.1 hypothetical protein [Candidatus Omnitrophota bacterium]